MFVRTRFALLFLLMGCVNSFHSGRDVQIESRLSSDEEIVGRCKSLECEYLDLSDSKLGDYSFLSSMPHVIDLNLARSDIASLSDISNLAHLRSLDIRSTKITSLKGIGELRHLVTLVAHDNSIESGAGDLIELEFLKELHVDPTGSQLLSSVAQVNSLQFLYLGEGTVVDLNLLSGSRSISDLYIRSEVRQDLKPLLAIDSLKWVYIDISEVPPWVVEDFGEAGVLLTDFPTPLR